MPLRIYVRNVALLTEYDIIRRNPMRFLLTVTPKIISHGNPSTFWTTLPMNLASDLARDFKDFTRSLQEGKELLHRSNETRPSSVHPRLAEVQNAKVRAAVSSVLYEAEASYLIDVKSQSQDRSR